MSSHTFSRHRPLHSLPKTRLISAQNHGMWRRTHNSELDTSKDSGCASHGPPPHTGGLDNATEFSLLAASETRYNLMDNSAPGDVHDANTDTPLPP